MATTRLSPEQRARKRERDKAYRARQRAKSVEEKKEIRRKALKAARDKRYRERKRREAGLPVSKKKKKKGTKKDQPSESALRARKYRKALKKRIKKHPDSWIVKQKLWFLYRETVEPKLSPSTFRVSVSKLGQVRARLTILNKELSFFDINDLVDDVLTYDQLLNRGYLQGFAAFIEKTKAGEKITSPPRASRASAGGVYRHHAATWFYDLSNGEGQVARCMGTAEKMISDVEKSSRGGLVKDSFGINYDWTTDHTRPDRESFGLSR